MTNVLEHATASEPGAVDTVLAFADAAEAAAFVVAKSLSEWWQEAAALALGEPAAWAFLGAAIVAGLAGRQFCILVAALLVAALGATLVTANAGHGEGAPFALAVAIQTFLVLAAWEHRRRRVRLARALAASEAAGADLVSRLEREIRWRRSAEETMVPSPRPAPQPQPEAELGKPRREQERRTFRAPA